jgi:hypothetical protein
MVALDINFAFVSTIFPIRFFNIGVENLSSRETTNLLQVIDKIYQIKLYRV